MRNDFAYAFVIMSPLRAVLLSAFLHVTSCTHSKLPSHFMFGAATSSYQIEGGWDADGKGESIWDRTVHGKPSYFPDNATGDIASDSYHLWREDIRIAKELGLHFYRFSISWPRILPTGFHNKINKAGVKYYSDLIDGLLAAGIEPLVTIYHWELPVALQDLGGWTNPVIIKWFSAYANIVYSLYADRVKKWLTINEPEVICDLAYNLGKYAPNIIEPEFAPYLCNKNVLLAHAEAYRIYHKYYKPKYNGRVSWANNVVWCEPATPEDIEVTELCLQHSAGRYSHPIYSKEGGWPPSIERVILEFSLRQGYNESRLPAFTKNEKQYIRGTADFYSLNHYVTYKVRSARPGEDTGVWFLTGSREINAILMKPAEATFGASAMLPVYPKGLRRQLNWLKNEYGDFDILITEGGYSSRGYQLEDYERIDYLKDHLEQVRLAVEDGVNVIGYTVWSLIDNFEWMDAYRVKFGLYEVDFEDPNRRRTARKSAEYYSCVIKSCSPTGDCLKNIPSREKRTKHNRSISRHTFKWLHLVLVSLLFNLISF